MRKRTQHHRTPTPKEMMNQGTSPSIPAPEKSVKGLQKQGTAGRFPGQGTRSVKSLMDQ